MGGYVCTEASSRLESDEEKLAKLTPEEKERNWMNCLKSVEANIFKFAFNVEAFVHVLRGFLKEEDFLEEKNLTLVPGTEIPCKNFQMSESDTSYGWRLYVTYVPPKFVDYSSRVFCHFIYPYFFDAASQIYLGYFFPEGNVTYKLAKGKFPEELISFCKMKQTIPFVSAQNKIWNLRDKIDLFLRDKLKLKLGENFDAYDLISHSYGLAVAMHSLASAEEKSVLLQAAVNDFGCLSSETSKALHGTSAQMKSKKLKAIREHLEIKTKEIVAKVKTDT